MEHKKITSIYEIERQIKNLVGCYKDKRQTKIREVSLNLYDSLKQFGYVNVERSFLMTFFNDLKVRTSTKFFNEIINYLIKNNKIRKSEKFKSCIRLQEKPLFSYINKRGESITNSKLSCVKSTFKFKVVCYELL